MNMKRFLSLLLDAYEGSGYRFHGRSIRPVQDKPEAESVSAGV